MYSGNRGQVVPSFLTKDLVTVQKKVGEGRDQKNVMVCSMYIRSDYLPLKNLENYLNNVRRES